ncbi:MAG: glycosyltransferase [Rhodospirillales bacterium]|nr:glycosyltransferase [Alphaproteobacteria bacterium]MBL6948488.1 glycosyltransferase [Rhodospirillales bacterium]
MLALRGRFWRADQRLVDAPADRTDWPDVVCVIPARNEAPTIGRTVASLTDQDYPAGISVIVVDDNSDDGTADAAGQTAKHPDRLSVITGKPLQEGWSGKLWAVHQGLEAARTISPDAPFVLLTDADITHDPESLRRLVAKAESDGLDLVSLMVRLRCESLWEKLLIPAFIFFFQKLYPFPWVNDANNTMAAAAGGCMLVRRSALDRAGGVDAIRHRLIDDCALAGQLKANGPIWLGLSTRVVSERRYEHLSEIWDMVARTAFEQLGNSGLALIGTVVAMLVTYVVPPLAGLGFLGGGPVMAAGLATWLGLMGLAFYPTLRLYGLPLAWGVLLPLAAFLYTLMTISSALRYWQGRGGAWKGRHYKTPSPSSSSEG